MEPAKSQLIIRQIKQDLKKRNNEQMCRNNDKSLPHSKSSRSSNHLLHSQNSHPHHPTTTLTLSPLSSLQKHLQQTSSKTPPSPLQATQH